MLLMIEWWQLFMILFTNSTRLPDCSATINSAACARPALINYYPIKAGLQLVLVDDS